MSIFVPGGRENVDAHMRCPVSGSHPLVSLSARRFLIVALASSGGAQGRRRLWKACMRVACAPQVLHQTKCPHRRSRCVAWIWLLHALPKRHVALASLSKSGFFALRPLCEAALTKLPSTLNVARPPNEVALSGIVSASTGWSRRFVAEIPVAAGAPKE